MRDASLRTRMPRVERGSEGMDAVLRVAVIDIGTNSTRLLIGDVSGTSVTEIERRTTVTNMGRGVDHSGLICSDAVDDVCTVIGDYKSRYEEMGAERVRTIATSAVRDAVNGEAFIAELRERFGLDARPMLVTVVRRSTSVTLVPSTSPINSLVEFVPMSTTATRTRASNPSVPRSRRAILALREAGRIFLPLRIYSEAS